jgi:DNA uptake protein ComE-like DNA-binding protein
MSAAQAKRAIRYRDEGRIASAADLADVPGFPRAFVDGLEGRITD